MKVTRVSKRRGKNPPTTNRPKLRAKQLEMLCVTQRWLLERYMQRCENLATRCESMQSALRDALAFFDRVNASKSDWTVREVLRLAELRREI